MLNISFQVDKLFRIQKLWLKKSDIWKEKKNKKKKNKKKKKKQTKKHQYGSFFFCVQKVFNRLHFF